MITGYKFNIAHNYSIILELATKFILLATSVIN